MLIVVKYWRIFLLKVVLYRRLILASRFYCLFFYIFLHVFLAVDLRACVIVNSLIFFSCQQLTVRIPTGVGAQSTLEGQDSFARKYIYEK